MSLVKIVSKCKKKTKKTKKQSCSEHKGRRQSPPQKWNVEFFVTRTAKNFRKIEKQHLQLSALK